MTSALETLLSEGPVFERGHVWLVGAGPGDPGLLTVHAIRSMEQADVVVFDALVDSRILGLVREDAIQIFAGKRGGKPSAAQGDITAKLIEWAGNGHRVLRLKGGDPFVFGRGGEECAALVASGVPFRVVPGVTSALAALVAARIPLTMRGVNQGVFIATGHGAGQSPAPDSIDWQAVARLGQPIVLYMAMSTLGYIREHLISGGMPSNTPAAIIVSATMPEERILVSTLAQIVEDARRAKLSPPAIVAFGDIVLSRDALIGAAEMALASAGLDDVAE